MLLTSIQTFTNLFTDFNTYHYKLVYWLHDKPLLTSIQTTTTFVSPLVNPLIVSTNIILWQVKVNNASTSYKPFQNCLLMSIQTITNMFTDFITNHYKHVTDFNTNFYKLVYWLQYILLQTCLLTSWQTITDLNTNYYNFCKSFSQSVNSVN